MFTNPRRDSLSAKLSEDPPRLKRPKPSANWHAVIHVISFCGLGVTPQVLRHKREHATQPFDIAHVQNTEIKRDEKHLVRIDDEGIGTCPAFSDSRFFG